MRFVVFRLRIGGTKAAFYCIAQNLIDRLLIDNRIAIENFTTLLCQQRMNALINVVILLILDDIDRLLIKNFSDLFVI